VKAKPAGKLRKRIPWLILILAIGIFIWHSSSTAFLQDDSYITYRYARNIVRGQGPVFNPNERVEGYTNFLWMMFIATFGILGLPFSAIIPLSQIIGVICGIGVMVLFFLLVRRHTCGPPSLASLAVLILAFNGAFAYWCVSGMETGLFTLFLAAAFFTYLTRSTSRNLLLTSSLLGLSALTRPEGALFMAIFALHFIIRSIDKSYPFMKSLKRFGLLVLPFILLVAPLYIWRLNYYGYLFPNTFYAKTGISISYIKTGLQYLANFYKAYGLWGIAFIVPLILAIIRKRLSPASPLFLAVLILAVQALYVVSVGGDVLRIYRFFVPVLIMFYFLFTEGIWLLPVGRPVQTLLMLAIMPLTFWGILAQPRSVRADIIRNQALENGLVAKMSTTGRWLNQHLNKDDWFACTTIGAVSYFSDRNMIDMLGLTDAVIAHNPENILSSRWHWKERNYNTRHVLERNPAYIYFSTGVKPSAEAERALFLRPRFRLGYFACPITMQQGNRLYSEIIYKAKPGADTLPTEPVARPSGFINDYLDGINFLRLGPDTAIACFRRTAEKSPRDFAYPYEWLGRIYLDAGKTDIAIGYFQDALTRNDWCITSHTSLASIYIKRGELGKAAYHLRKVNLYAPDYYAGYVNLAATAARLNNYAEAETVTTQAINRFPKIPGLRLRLAYVLMQSGKLDKAEAVLHEFLIRNPQERNALGMLKEIHQRRAHLGRNPKTSNKGQ